MSIPDFDYQSFVADLATQAVAMLPSDITESERDYIISVVISLGCRAAEEIVNDDYEFWTSIESKIIVQFVCEWVYHKGVDYIRAKIPKICIESLLKELADVVFVVAKDCYYKNLELKPTARIIENQARTLCETSVNALLKNGYITVKQRDKAIVKSCFEDVVNKSSADTFSDSKILKMGAFVVLIRATAILFAHEIVEMFEDGEREVLEHYLNLSGLKSMIDKKVLGICLSDMNSVIFDAKDGDFSIDGEKMLNLMREKIRQIDKEELKDKISEWFDNDECIKEKYRFRRYNFIKNIFYFFK